MVLPCICPCKIVCNNPSRCISLDTAAFPLSTIRPCQSKQDGGLLCWLGKQWGFPHAVLNHYVTAMVATDRVFFCGSDFITCFTKPRQNCARSYIYCSILVAWHNIFLWASRYGQLVHSRGITLLSVPHK